MLQDLIVPRGIENTVAISMMTERISSILHQKSKLHQLELSRLGRVAEDVPLSDNVTIVPETPQTLGMSTMLLADATDREDFIFYFDRMASLLVER